MSKVYRKSYYSIKRDGTRVTTTIDIPEKVVVKGFRIQPDKNPSAAIFLDKHVKDALNVDTMPGLWEFVEDAK